MSQQSYDICTLAPNAYIDGLVQDCSISSALAMEIVQSSTKPSIYLEWMIRN